MTNLRKAARGKPCMVRLHGCVRAQHEESQMRTETITPDCFTIFDAKGLDPITVVIQDMGGCGRLIVECYGKAWSTYFGAFGTGPMREFLTGCDVGYVANRLEPRGGSYLHDITAAVLTALRPNTEAKPTREAGSA